MTTNLRKAAVLLMSLPPNDAARLLSLLEPAMVEAVSVEIARTERVSGSEQDAVAEEFSEAQPVDGSEGGLHVAQALLERALGERAGETIDHVRQTVEPPPLDFLQAVAGDRLLSLVRNEQPQTIALILLHMGPARGTELLRGLSAEQQWSVIRRMANMGRVDSEIVREVARGLQHALSGTAWEPLSGDSGVLRAVELLNTADRDTRRRLLENLADEDPDLFHEIRRRLGAAEPHLHRAA